MLGDGWRCGMLPGVLLAANAHSPRRQVGAVAYQCRRPFGVTFRNPYIDSLAAPLSAIDGI